MHLKPMPTNKVTGCITALYRIGIDYRAPAELPMWAKALFSAHRQLGSLAIGYRTFEQHALFLYVNPQCQATVECAVDISVSAIDLFEIVEDLIDGAAS